MPKKGKITIEQLRKGADYGKLPMIVERVAAAVKKSNPNYSKSTCIAIAIARLQELGYLKKGTVKLTEKGKKLTAKMSKREPTAPNILLRWNLAELRRERSRRKKRKKKSAKKKKKKS